MCQSEYKRSSSEEIVKNLFDLHERTVCSREFDKMAVCVSPFLNHFGLNHFYYVKISPSGDYTTLGTHCEFHEFGFDQPKLLSSYPCMRHPNKINPGIFIESNNLDHDYIETSNIIWNKFQINFTICLRRKINDDVVFFGFGTNNLKSRVAESLLNELVLVNFFIDYFVRENKKLIQIADENRVNIIPMVGSRFYEMEKGFINLPQKFALLHQMKLDKSKYLTVRENEILQYLSKGYSAKYIASKLFISHRTVENYIAAIKLKFDCINKDELIDCANKLLGNYSF